MKNFFLLFILVISSQIGNSQYVWDVGVKFGAANYLGEMGGKDQPRRDFISDMKLNQTKWAMGIMARRRITPLFSIAGALMYGRLQGDDKLSTIPGRVGRNQNFRNDLLELSLRPELFFLHMYDVGGAGWYRLDFHAYAFSGLAVYYSNPKGKLENSNSWIPLQPLQTEGIKYSKFGMSIPVGVGFYLTYKKHHRFGWDIGWRTTFSDYLDDVSRSYVSDEQFTQMSTTAQSFANRRNELSSEPGIPQQNNYGNGNKRGDPTHNHSYLFTTFTYSYVIRGRSITWKRQFPWWQGGKPHIRNYRVKF